MYVPWNVPIEVLGRALAFEEVESRDKVFVPIIEGERAGNGNGNRDGDDKWSGDVDGMTSGDDVDSTRVNAVQLAGEGQRMHYSQRKRINIPMSSWPPIQHANCPYGDARHQQRHGRIKIAPINISQMKEVEMTHLEHAQAMQPHRNSLKCHWDVHKPKH